MMDQNKSQDIRRHMLPKEIDSKASILANPTSTIPGMTHDQDTISKTNMCVLGTGSPSLEPRVQKNNEHSCPMKKIILQVAETILVNLNFTCPIYKISNPDKIHLFTAKSVEFISGTEASDHIDDQHKEITRCLDAKVKQEVTTRNFLIPYDPGDQEPLIRVPDQNRGVVMSLLPKGEPPDVPSKIKPIKYQGKVLESQRRMKPDLLYLGTDYPVSRSKLFQGGGYDAAIKSVVEPEANQLHQSANQKTNQEMCSIKTSYLTNQE